MTRRAIASKSTRVVRCTSIYVPSAPVPSAGLQCSESGRLASPGIDSRTHCESGLSLSKHLATFNGGDAIPNRCMDAIRLLLNLRRQREKINRVELLELIQQQPQREYGELSRHNDEHVLLQGVRCQGCARNFAAGRLG